MKISSKYFFLTDPSRTGSGSIRPFFSKDGSEASTTPLASEATPTAPPTPPVELHLEDPFKHNVNGLLPSAASVVRALSPLLSPAFQAANNMSQKVLKAKEAVHGGLHESDQVVVEEEPAVHKISPKDLPMMTQVNHQIIQLFFPCVANILVVRVLSLKSFFFLFDQFQSTS